ncbi:MAG: hypothetical protein WD317_11660 [Balneolaceae bacterium]
MDIDLTSIIISIVALSFFFVPIFYYEVYKKRAAKKLESYFNDLARENKIGLTQYEVWRDSYAIGIDRDSNHVFYLKKNNAQDKTDLVDLSEIKKCRVSRIENKIKTDNGYTKITSRVDLELTHYNPKFSDIKIEFFREEGGNTLRNEVLLAEKWSGVINSRLSKY